MSCSPEENGLPSWAQVPDGWIPLLCNPCFFCNEVECTYAEGCENYVDLESDFFEGARHLMVDTLHSQRGQVHTPKELYPENAEDSSLPAAIQDDIVQRSDDDQNADSSGNHTSTVVTPRAPASLPVRHRVKHACDWCHRRKIKCNGQQPCTDCYINSFDCTYDQRPNRRGKPAAPPHPFRAAALEKLHISGRVPTLSLHCHPTKDIFSLGLKINITIHVIMGISSTSQIVFEEYILSPIGQIPERDAFRLPWKKVPLERYPWSDVDLSPAGIAIVQQFCVVMEAELDSNLPCAFFKYGDVQGRQSHVDIAYCFSAKANHKPNGYVLVDIERACYEMKHFRVDAQTEELSHRARDLFFLEIYQKRLKKRPTDNEDWALTSDWRKHYRIELPKPPYNKKKPWRG